MAKSKGFNVPGLKRFLGEKKKTVKPWVLWDDYIWSYFKRHSSEDSITRKYNLYGDNNAIYSGMHNISYVFTIEGYPKELELSFRKTLRRECKTGVRMTFINNYQRDNIDWNSPSNKNRMKTWKHLEDSSDKNVTVYDLAGEVGTLDAQEYKRSSLLYLINADLRRKRKLFNVRSLLIVSGQRGEAFDDTITELIKTCKSSQIKLKRVRGNITDYLETFSPFSLKIDGSLMRRIGSNVMTDEIIARFNSYDQGTVGYGTLIFGSDIYSKKTVLKEPKESGTDAENWLISAETGGGKSFMAKSLVLQLLARSDMVGTINDIEGDEYTDMGYIVANSESVVMLDIGDSGGTYFDPVEIHMTGNPTLDKDMFSLSYSFTLGVLKTLLGDKILEKRDWAITIIKNSVQNFYSDLGATRYDATTWVKTKGKTLFDVFEAVKQYEPEGANEEFHLDKQLVVSTLEGYLGELGKEDGRFKNKVSIDSIKDAKLVINSFGMKGRSQQTVDEVDMALMQLYTALISHLRSVFAFAENKFNFKIWEEFQRWGHFPGSEETLQTPLSGGRKLGDINIIITNRPSELLENDRFKIFDSITTFAIGAVGDSRVRENLCERLGMPLMKKELDLIESNRSKDGSGRSVTEEYDVIKRNPYSKAFLIGLEKRHYSVAKVQLPKSLSQTKLFSTGIDKEQSNSKEVI